MRRHSRPFACLALLLVAAVAVAGPRQELHAAFGKFLDASSFRATLTDLDSGKVVSEMEFVAPDRYRMRMPGGPAQLIVGDSLYVDTGNGSYMKLPIPGGRLAAQFRDRTLLEELQRELTVTGGADDSVDGEPAAVYSYRTTRHGQAEVTTWVSQRTGLPLQFETRGASGGKQYAVRVRYRDFNDPGIRIDPPQ